MFEKFTESARRSIFFARYDASSLGTPYISTEHILLGILREDKSLVRQALPNITHESTYEDIAARVVSGTKKLPTSVDLPLTEDSQNALKWAMDEADRLHAHSIGTEHLLLALVQNSDYPAAKLLSRLGTDPQSLRKRIQALPGRLAPQEHVVGFRHRSPDAVEIHGKKHNVEFLSAVVSQLKKHTFYWERRLWQARDIVYERSGKRFSFDLSLAHDTEKFLLVKAGWKKDNCAICRWELFESEDPVHGWGFTNGAVWICEECHRRFIVGDFFSSPYSDLT